MYYVSIFILLVTLTFFLYRWHSRNLIAEIRKRNVPYGTQPSFFKILFFKERVELYQQQTIRRLGKLYGYYSLGKVTLVIAEPELIQLVLSKNFTQFPNRRKILTNDSFLLNAISTVEMDQWKRLRAIIAQTFSTGKLRRLKPCLDTTCKTLIENIDNHLAKSEEKILDIKPLVSTFIMDALTQVEFGVKIDSLTESENAIIQNSRKIVNDISLKNIFILIIMFQGPRFCQKLFKRLNFFNYEAINFFRAFSHEIIERKRKEFMQKGYANASNFIEFLLEAEHEYELQKEKMNKVNLNSKTVMKNGQTNSTKLIKFITNEELIAQCVLFLSIGVDATSNAIILACYYLALNPEKQQVAYEEICRVIAEHGLQSENRHNLLQSIPFESFGNKFEYVNSVINETLRIAPFATLIERRAMNDCTLATNDGRYEVRVKKDDIIQIPVWSLHYNEEYFPEPEQFRPERFFRETAYSFPKYAYLPFGSGPRDCIAKSLSILEIKMALIWLISNYKFSKCLKTKIPVEFYYQNALLCARDIFLKLEPR